MKSRRSIALALLADAALVLVFVLIGRASHDENPVLGALVTLWPFLVGLLFGWLVSRAWHAPIAVVRTGIPVWASTVIVGMLLRWASGQGVQVSFIIVTCIVLAFFLLGWRLVAALVWRRRSRKSRQFTTASSDNSSLT